MSVVLLLWVTFGLQHAAGNIVHPVTFWRFALDQGLIVVVASVGGWLLARGRHPLTLLADNSFPSGAIALISQATVALVGLGAVWLAVWIDRFLGERAHEEGSDAEASDPLPQTADLVS
ncbi:hypothetical protein [uncultured Microbacterium sp.]|uniref:hypothetical protein n=1 Tax=uncultured Microbacterium sp. TaxID=191216 RepID=UPI002629DA41|nr:hypothetical protein [uncultured Microbacterium sp.]